MFWNSLAFLLFLLHYFLQLIQPEPLQQNLLKKLGSNKYCFSHQPYLLVNAQFDQHFVTKANLNVKNKYKFNIWIDEINIKKCVSDNFPNHTKVLNWTIYKKTSWCGYFGVVIFRIIYLSKKTLALCTSVVIPLSFSNMQVCAKMCFFKHVCCLYMNNSVSC